jgi:hypothetical protein
MTNLVNRNNSFSWLGIDIINISDPDVILEFETSGALKRLHEIPTSELPFYIQYLFPTTRLFDNKGDQWQLAFEPLGDDYNKRKKFHETTLGNLYSEKEIKHIADLIINKADDVVLRAAVANLLCSRFFDNKQTVIPNDILQAASEEYFTNPLNYLNPYVYYQSVSSLRKIHEFVKANTCPNKANYIDVTHNICTAVTGIVKAIRFLQNNTNMSIENQLFEIIDSVSGSMSRIAVKESTLNGRLQEPLVPKRTIVFYNLPETVRLSKDMKWVFGIGSENRVCCGKQFILRFMTDLQTELLKYKPDDICLPKKSQKSFLTFFGY